MATITANTTTETEGDQCVVMRGVDWKGYSAVLALRGERSRPTDGLPRRGPLPHVADVPS